MKNKLISIVVCTKDRKHCLSNLLSCLSKLEQVTGWNAEIIVVDNASKDDTAEVVKSFIANNTRYQISYLLENVPGAARTRNRGIAEAGGEIIAFTDDDCLPDKNWISNIITAFEESPDLAIAGGQVLPLRPESIPSWIIKNKKLFWGPIVLIETTQEKTNYQINKSAPFASANMAVRKSVFEKIGVFNESLGKGTGSLGEDTEFLQRALKHNLECILFSNIISHHDDNPERYTVFYIISWWMMKYKFYWRTDRLQALLLPVKTITKIFGLRVF